MAEGCGSSQTQHHAEIQRRFNAEIGSLQCLTDRVFFWLLLAQWIFGIGCAFVISPLTWSGEESSIHVHLWTAIFLGGMIVSVPCWMIHTRKHSQLTRMVVASAQVLFASLLIHLMGGRIEAHFHIFGSLAIISFYRDRWVYVPSVIIVFVDHMFRGVLWPESVFGVMSVSVLRAFEHVAWVLFEVSFLLWGITQSRRHIYELSRLAVELHHDRDTLEDRVNLRTRELKSSKEFLQSILDSLPLEICIVNRSGNVIKTNAEWTDRKVKKLNGHSFTDNYLAACRQRSPDENRDTHRLADAVEQILETGQGSYRSEFQSPDDQHDRWYQVNATPLQRDNSRVVVISHQDITERVRAEKQLHQQKEEADRLALVARYTDNAVVITDSEGRIEWVNDGFTRLSGYQLDEAMGMTTGEFLEGPKTASETIDYMDSHYRQKLGFNVEIVNYSKSGSTYWISREVRPIRDPDGEVTKFIAIEMDITEKKQREQQLSLLDNAVDYCSDAMFLVDEEGRIVDANLKASLLLEYEQDEFLYMSIDDVTPGVQSQIHDNENLRVGVADVFEETLVAKSGRNIPVEVSASPVEHNGLQYCCVFARDVTERKNAELERSILADELQSAARQAGMAEVATGVLHNVGNILNSVNISASVIRKQLQRGSISRLQRLSELVNQNLDDFPEFVRNDQRGKILPSYITQLATAFEKEQGQIDKEFQEMVNSISLIKDVVATQQSMAKSKGVIQETRVADLIGDTVNVMKGDIARHHIDLTVVSPADDLSIATDKHKAIMILVNLVKNAKDSVVDSGVQVPRIKISVEQRMEGDMITGLSISVEDNGVGIAKDRLDQIFKHGHSTKKYGHGFGLHSSANAATQLGGSLTAQSDGERRGATFVLRLPIDSAIGDASHSKKLEPTGEPQ
ncbi:MAG: PAS domain S-box protein [Planctomycetota bacterium]